MDLSGNLQEDQAKKKLHRKEYDRQHYLKRKMEKQPNGKNFFVKNPGQLYTIIRRTNIEKKLKENEARADAFRAFLNSHQNI